MKDKERKNRPLVKSLLKSPKQIAKDKWIELKQSAETIFNEMANSVSDSVDQLKEELINQINAELDFIKDLIDPSLQEVSYKCNKAFRLFNQYKFSSKEKKNDFIKVLWEEIYEYGEELGNAFILFVTYETIAPMREMFRDLWTCGIESWAECKNNWEALIDFLNGKDKIDNNSKKNFHFNQTVNEIIPFLNSLLPVILSLITLITNYIINKGGSKDIGSRVTEKLEKDNLLYMEVPEAEVDRILKDEGVDQTVGPIYEDCPDPSSFKFPIGDSKLYPYMKKDVYDLSLGCWIEPSQILRVIREDQFKMKSIDFISRTNDSSSSYDQYEDGQENSLCYIIPPSKRNSNDIIENEDEDSNGNGDCLHAIIEFDDDCCAVPAEPFAWKCLPGEWVYQDKVLAECKQYEVMLPVKSIFTSGVIRKDPCTGDFGRIRKDVCNRHIIIDCFEDGTKGLLDASVFEKLVEDFKREQCMYRLFYEYMPYSILPNIISRKKYYEVPTKYRWEGTLSFLTKEWIENDGMPEAYNDIYLPYVEHYENTIENFKHEMMEIDSEERIKATNGEYDKIDALMNETLEARRRFVWGLHNWSKEEHGIVDLYDSYKDNLNKSKCFDDYRDARGLGETYYTDLIAMLIFTEYDKCILDYYELLEDIIYKRELVEGYDWFMLKRKICGELNAISDLEWSDLEKAYRGPNDFNAISALVASHIYEKLKNKEKRIYPVVNLYMLYKRKMDKVHYHEYGSITFEHGLFHGYDHLKENFEWNIKSSDYSNEKILDLVKEEKVRLEEFFKEKRLAYQEITLESLIQRAKELDEIQAEWPPYTEIFVDGIQYRLYKFANIDAWLKKNSQKKGEDNSLANPGDIDPYSWIYSEPSDEKIQEEVDANSDGLEDATEKALNGDSPLVTNDVDDKFCPMMEVPITDMKYWKRYCGMATLATIPFLATGLVILGVPIPFPAIYIPLVVVNGDVLMVIGIGNRGITFFPMVLYVNASHDYSTALVPILIALKAVRNSFQKQLSKLELAIPNVADLMMDQLEGNNANLLNQNKQIDQEIANLKTRFKPSWAHVQKEIKKYIGVDDRQKVARLE